MLKTCYNTSYGMLQTVPNDKPIQPSGNSHQKSEQPTTTPALAELVYRLERFVTFHMIYYNMFLTLEVEIINVLCHGNISDTY